MTADRSSVLHNSTTTETSFKTMFSSHLKFYPNISFTYFNIALVIFIAFTTFIASCLVIIKFFFGKFKVGYPSGYRIWPVSECFIFLLKYLSLWKRFYLEITSESIGNMFAIISLLFQRNCYAQFFVKVGRTSDK